MAGPRLVPNGPVWPAAYAEDAEVVGGSQVGQISADGRVPVQSWAPKTNSLSELNFQDWPRALTVAPSGWAG
jgi:hypothetical protein